MTGNIVLRGRDLMQPSITIQQTRCNWSLCYGAIMKE